MKGGGLIATDGNCSIGPPLTDRVDTFLGIAGANYGLCMCQFAQTIPAWCNALDGLYPGYTCEDQVLIYNHKKTAFLEEIEFVSDLKFNNIKKTSMILKKFT